MCGMPLESRAVRPSEPTAATILLHCQGCGETLPGNPLAEKQWREVRLGLWTFYFQDLFSLALAATWFTLLLNVPAGNRQAGNLLWESATSAMAVLGSLTWVCGIVGKGYCQNVLVDPDPPFAFLMSLLWDFVWMLLLLGTAVLQLLPAESLLLMVMSWRFVDAALTGFVFRELERRLHSRSGSVYFRFLPPFSLLLILCSILLSSTPAALVLGCGFLYSLTLLCLVIGKADLLTRIRLVRLTWKVPSA